MHTNAPKVLSLVCLFALRYSIKKVFSSLLDVKESMSFWKTEIAFY